MKFFALLVFGALLMMGCAFTPPPKPEYFLLNPGKPISMQVLRTSVPMTVSVSFVEVAAPFASNGFVYQISNNRWEMDPYNQFLVSPSDMMTSIVRNWIHDSGLFSEVTAPGLSKGHRYVIDCAFTELYGDFRTLSAPEAVVTLVAQVFRDSNKGRIVVLHKTFTQRVPLTARRPAALISAWNEALKIELNLLLRAISKNSVDD